MLRVSVCVLIIAAASLMAGEPGPAPASGSPGGKVKSKRADIAKNERPPDYYLEEIHDAVYRKWEQPVYQQQPGPSLQSRIKIRIERSGRISRIELVKSSGNVAMDDSVLKAAKAVDRLPPLPDSFHGAHFEVPIEFILSSD